MITHKQYREAMMIVAQYCAQIEEAKQPASVKTIGARVKLSEWEAYSKFLEDQGYLDTDWRTEAPYAIDEFLKTQKP